MTRTWYSKKLLADTDERRDSLVVSFIRPLVQQLDREGAAYRFHFFRYSGPSSSPILRGRSGPSGNRGL